MRKNVYSIVAIMALVFTISSQIPTVNSAKILGLFTSHSASHLIVHMSVVKALADRGHNVTVVTCMKPKVTHKDVRTIVIPGTPEQERILEEQIEIMANKKNSAIDGLKNMFGSMNVIIDMQFDIVNSKLFAELYNEKFDLVILGYFFNDFQLGVAAKFKCPVIVNWMGSPNTLVDKYVGNPEEVSYVPNMHIGVKAGERMSFIQRIQNHIGNQIFNIIKLIIDFRMENFYRQLFPNDGSFPTLEEMRKNVSLLFCNSHFSEGPVRPNVPALVEIGGIQVKDKPNKLPQDIAEFLDGSKDKGAILFSLGSNVQSTHMPPERVQSIFKALSSLKQNVIWKWEDANKTPGKSANILYKNWLPQDDILAHPNLKLFITHAGKGGIVEAQYHDVPMVALPVFGDQMGNAERVASSGYGLSLELLKITETNLKEAVLEVLENPRYSNNIKKFSQLFRDRPLSSRETVVFWTEYVLRHHGASHMQSPLVHMNFLQSSSLDVIGFICLTLFVVWKVLKHSIKFVCKKLCSKCKNSNDQKIKKQ